MARRDALRRDTASREGRPRPRTLYDKILEARKERERVLSRPGADAPRSRLPEPDLPPERETVRERQTAAPVPEPGEFLSPPLADAGPPPIKGEGPVRGRRWPLMLLALAIGGLAALAVNRPGPVERLLAGGGTPAAVRGAPVSEVPATSAAPVPEGAAAAKGPRPAAPVQPSVAPSVAVLAPVFPAAPETGLPPDLPADVTGPPVPAALPGAPSAPGEEAGPVVQAAAPVAPKPKPVQVPAAQPVPAPAPEPAPVQANANIVLHVPSGVTAARMARASDTLAGAGYPPDRTLRIDLVIGASNVRYYFPADAALARRIGRQLGATVRDFTNYRPRPSEGLIEVWLEGRPAAVPLQRDARLPPLVTGIARALSEALNGPPGTAGR